MIIFSVAALLARAICANGVSLESSLNGGRGSVEAVFQLAPPDPGVKQAKPGGPSAEGAERGRVWGGGVPLPIGKIFRFMSSKRRPLVHSGYYFCS